MKLSYLFIFLVTFQLSACDNGRFKTYRSTGLNVIDKKSSEEQREDMEDERKSNEDYERLNMKKLLGQELTPDEFALFSLCRLRKQYPDTYKKAGHNITLSSDWNPRWIEIKQNEIDFKDKDKKIVKTFKIKSIDKQEGIDNADWIIEIEDKQVETAVLSEHHLRLNSSTYGHFDYIYSFYQKEK